MLRINQNEDCPTEDFEVGTPQGKCWGDGHYECENCKHFRADFKANPNMREGMIRAQGFIQIRTLKS
jgi:hypothetical protein